jgi:hypothetical protein
LRVVVIAQGRVIGRSRVRFVTAGDPGAIFYSGKGDAGAGDVGDNVVRLVASFQLLGLGPHFDGQWTGSNECETSHAVTAGSNFGSEPITELAGFSLGRLGPVYFLHSSSWVSQISYILLLDPGSTSEMASSCDSHSSIAPAATLARWLGMRSSNRLVVMAGPATLSDKYAGLDKYYLSGFPPALQQQVLICYSGSPDHDSFLEGQKGGFGWMVGAPPPTTCPPHTQERTNWRTPASKAPPLQPVPPKSTAPAAPGPLPAGEFYVMNAEGGVFWRSTPNWNTPEAVAGNGFYPGTVIKVACYQSGTADVPGTTDGMWEQASWASGPGSGSGWINEHFINDNAPLGQPSPGTPACSNSAPPPTPPSPSTWSEQETPNHPVNTFTNYHNASGMGPAIASGQWVQVSCKVYDPTIASVNPDGYWYRIASAPWNNAYYSPANTFMNGDPYGGPYTHNTDFSVPAC